MPWWGWMFIGALLLGPELLGVEAAFYLVFVGIAAMITGLHRVAQSLITEGGDASMQLHIAEAYVQQFGNLAKEGNTLVVPSNLADAASMIALATNIARKESPGTS